MRSGRGKGLKFCMPHPKGTIGIAEKLADGVPALTLRQAKNDADAGRTFVKSAAKDAV